MALCRGFAVPLHGQFVVFGHAMTFVVAASQSILRLFVPFFGCGLQFGNGSLIVLGIVECLTLFVELVYVLCAGECANKQSQQCD